MSSPVIPRRAPRRWHSGNDGRQSTVFRGFRPETNEPNRRLTVCVAMNDRELDRLDRLANLMDQQFLIPGSDIRVGLDSIIGLIPGIGDTASLAVSGY